MDDLIISLQDCLQKENGTIVKDMLQIKVEDTLPIFEYYRKDRTKGKMFTAAVCDKTSAVKLQIYDTAKITVVTKGSSLLLLDFIVRIGQICATHMTKIFRAPKGIEIPEEISTRAQDLLHAHQETSNEGEVSILRAATSPRRSVVTVKGVVYKVGPLETKVIRGSGEEVKFRKVKITDDTSKIPVILWRKLATTEIKVKDVIKCSDFSVSDTFNRDRTPIPSVTNKSSSATLEFLAPGDLVLDVDCSSDEESIPSGLLIAVAEFSTYRCCLSNSCYNRKLKEDRCPSCGVFYKGSAGGNAYIGQLLVYMNAAKEMKTFTVFTQQLNNLAVKLGVQLDEDFEKNVTTKLPSEIRFHSQANKITKIF